jgi:hypothetical protein
VTVVHFLDRPAVSTIFSKAQSVWWRHPCRQHVSTLSAVPARAAATQATSSALGLLCSAPYLQHKFSTLSSAHRRQYRFFELLAMAFGTLPQGSVRLRASNGHTARSLPPNAPFPHRNSLAGPARIKNRNICSLERLTGVCRAIAELDAPPAQTGLQLEVSFEEPLSKVPVTYITTTARVIASAFSTLASIPKLRRRYDLFANPSG